ncbi:MAG: cell division protein SepF [Anaerovoracaceae bacterium]
MSVLDKFKDLVGIAEIEDDDEIEEEEIKAAGAQLERKKVEPRNNYSQSNSKEKVIPMNRSTTPFKLIVIEPEGFEECPKLVDSLKAKKPVIINLETIDSDTARKIFDFLSGATYALNGNVQKIANNIFVFAPENVDISANKESKGFDFTGAQKDGWR